MNTSIKGSILIVSILLVKLILKDRLGARWHYNIWFLLLMRLIIPYAPKSSISIFNLFSFNGIKNIITKSYSKYNSDEIMGWFNGQLVEPNWLQDDTWAVNDVGFSKYTDFYLECSILAKVAMVWLAGAAILLLFTIIANVVFAINVRKQYIRADEQTNKILEECKMKMGIKTDLPVVLTEAVKTPALYGLIWPRLLLPANIEEQIDNNKLQYIILHELAHLKRKDIAAFWIINLLKIIYWFNPIIWYGLHQMRQDCEISCDALALSYVDQDDCKKYGHTIIHLLQNTTKPLKHIGVAGILGSKSQLKRRIKMITLFNKNTYKLSILSITILILMGFVFLTNANQETISPVGLEGEIHKTETDETNKIKVDDTEETLIDETSNAMIWPLPDSNKIVSPYGERTHPILNVTKKHTGIDIMGKAGDLIVAAADGKVIYSDFDEAYGKTVIIDHGKGIVSLYAHCSELLVEKDKEVKTGQEIAKVGTTGLATGPHLHFEIRKDGMDVDPFDGYLSKLE